MACSECASQVGLKYILLLSKCPLGRGTMKMHVGAKAASLYIFMRKHFFLKVIFRGP